MKTNELIEELEAMAYKPERITTMGGKEIIRITRETNRIIAIVDEKNEMAIDTKFTCFRNLSSVEKHNLYSLLTEYASTPLEEREEEKKYIYKLPVENAIGSQYCLKTNGCQEDVRIGGSIYEKITFIDSYHFTDAEVESYPEEIQALFKACEKELVE